MFDPKGTCSEFPCRASGHPDHLEGQDHPEDVIKAPKPPMSPEEATPDNPFRIGLTVRGTIQPATKRFLLKNKLGNTARVIAEQYHTAADQLAAIRRYYRFPDPKARKTKVRELTTAEKLQRQAEAKVAIEKNRAAALAHHAQSQHAQTQRQVFGLDPMQTEEERVHKQALHASILHSLGLGRPQATGLFLVEVSRGFASEAWKLTPAERKPGFWGKLVLLWQLLKIVFSLPAPETLAPFPEEKPLDINGTRVSPAEVAILKSTQNGYGVKQFDAAASQSNVEARLRAALQSLKVKP